MTNYKSDIKLGEKYEDTMTGLQGMATATTFYLHACERVTLEFVKDGEIKYESFDAPRVKHLKTETIPKTTRTGGPGGREARQHQPERR